MLNLWSLLPETDLTFLIAQPLISVSAFHVIHQRAYSIETGLEFLALSSETSLYRVLFYWKRSSPSFIFLSSSFVHPSPIILHASRLKTDTDARTWGGRVRDTIIAITFQMRRRSPYRSAHSLYMLWPCRNLGSYSPASHRCGPGSVPNYVGFFVDKMALG
jgi:hypothetical protein